MNLNAVGKWSFIVGLVIALLASFITGYDTAVMVILFIAGLLVGFLNITDKDVTKFLLSVVTLLILGVASLNALQVLGVISGYLNSILGNFISFVSAAGLVVAIKSIVETTKA